MPNPGRTALYRLYGRDDALLYVGIATDPEMRWNYHRGLKPWWNEVVRKAVEWHETRTEAAQAEAAAVRDENPRYNLTQPAEDGSAAYRLRTPKPKGVVPVIPTRYFAVPDDEWNGFGSAVKLSYSNRTKITREFIRWFTRQPGAKMPKRPAEQEDET